MSLSGRGCHRDVDTLHVHTGRDVGRYRQCCINTGSSKLKIDNFVATRTDTEILINILEGGTHRVRLPSCNHPKDIVEIKLERCPWILGPRIG